MALAAGDGAGDDERVSALKLDLGVGRALDRRAVPLDERVPAGEAESLEQARHGLARLELVLASVDGARRHGCVTRPATGLEG